MLFRIKEQRTFPEIRLLAFRKIYARATPLIS